MSHQPPNNEPWQHQPPNTVYPGQPPYQTGNLPPQPPPAPTKQSFWKRKAGCMPTWLLIVIICVISLYILVSIVSAASNGTSATPTIDATATQQDALNIQATATREAQIQLATIVAAPTDTPAPPTTVPTKQSAMNPTHGTPHIGGAISDFYGKYGQPHNQGTGDSETWLIDQQQTTLVNAAPDADEKVTSVIVTTGASWSSNQMKQYCSQFLPSDASQFNSVSDLTDYHSNVGEVVMQISPDAGSCTLNLSQS
jgi:hypothetical protein